MTIAAIDQDESLAIEGERPSEEQLLAREKVRYLLRSRRIVAMAQSMRTWELMLSSPMYDLSPEIKELRPVPKWGTMVSPGNGQVKFYQPLEGIKKFFGCLDWDAMLVPGNGIAFRNGSRYVIDHEYDELLRYHWGPNGASEPLEWRAEVVEFMRTLLPGIDFYFSQLEYEDNYKEGRSDVLTLQYRIQLDFEGREGFAQKEAFKFALSEARGWSKVARRLKTIDESNPTKDRYTLYVVPWWGTKEHLLKRFVTKSCEAAGVSPRDVRIPMVGDTLTDLRAGLYGGGEAQVTFLLPENSRLTPYVGEWLRARRANEAPAKWAHYFAGEPIAKLCRRLVPSGTREGEYTFNSPLRKGKPNRFMFGAEAYPGFVGAEAVLYFLQDELSCDNAGH